MTRGQAARNLTARVQLRALCGPLAAVPGGPFEAGCAVLSIRHEEPGTAGRTW